MTPWQRRARLALGVFVLIFAVGLFFALRRQQAAPPPAEVNRLDPKAVAESTAGVLTQVKGARQDFTIKFDRLLTYLGGATKLAGVTVDVAQRAGRSFVMTGREAEVGQDESTVTVTGDVHMTSNDGLVVDTDQVTYGRDEGMVRAPGKVIFSRGTLSGSAVGMTYDKQRDVLWLLDQVTVAIRSGEADGEDVEIAAGTAGWARRDKYMRFERSVTMLRGEQTLEAESATADPRPDEKRVQMIELRDESRITGGQGGAGSLRDMRARDMNLTYGDTGDKLQRALLAGDSSIEIAGGPTVGSRRLSADLIDLGLATDGTTVTSLDGRDRVELTLPAEGAVPVRTIRAGSVQGSGPEDLGLNVVRFTGQVQYRETPAAPAAARSASAQTLDLSTKPGLASIDEARFTGNVRFEEGGLSATAREAVYDLANGRLALAGAEEPANRPPQLVDERATIDAGRIEITLKGRDITAREGVQSVLRPARRPDDAGSSTAGEASRVPHILKQDQPVFATADELVYAEEVDHAVYTGSARLWQGDTAIQGDELVIDGRTGDLTAKGSARSSLLLQQTDPNTGEAKKVPTIASASELLYEDQARRATYTTSAHVGGSQGDLTADKVELYLTQSADALERAEAYGAVTVRPEGRTATGDRLTYFAADERYVMTGVPVKIIEECRETQGKTLTFFKSADRILIDGNEETRTQTKGGGKCGEPRFD